MQVLVTMDSEGGADRDVPVRIAGRVGEVWEGEDASEWRRASVRCGASVRQRRLEANGR
jgi:hypothetical protein